MRLRDNWPAFGLAAILALAMAPVAFAQDVVNGNTTVTSNAEAINGIPTDVIMWAGLVSVLAPILIGLINRPTWSSTTKGVCAAIVSILLGGITAYFAGDLSSVKDVVSAMLVVFTGAITFYRHWFEPSGIGAKLERTL